MINKIFIVGIRGNMASRYRAICEYLGKTVDGVDVDDPTVPDGYLSSFDGIIICTPTNRHTLDIKKYLRFEKPLLVEKPICPSYEYLQNFFKVIAEKRELITMVNQYKHLPLNDLDNGDSEYNYFKHGGDGISWDCINIHGLSKKPPILKDTSPVWTCSINGRNFSSAQMDYAYIDMIKDWCLNPKSNWEYALEAHRKAEQWQR